MDETESLAVIADYCINAELCRDDAAAERDEGIADHLIQLAERYEKKAEKLRASLYQGCL